MKKLSSYIATLAVGAAMVMGASSCDDDFTRPPMVVPPTIDETDPNLKANMSILDFKTQYWQNDRNYVAHLGYYSEEAEESIILSGRVVSSTESGNIYNNIVVQDESAAITISVRTGDMESVPLFGQLVYIDVTGLEVGGYNGLMQLGAEGVYNNAPSMTFMEGEVLDKHIKISGMPNPAAVDTALVTIPFLEGEKSNKDGLITWQSRLVRIENVSFTDAGSIFNDGISTVSRYVKDENGKRMLLRISSYADFAGDIIPGGVGAVTGILSYFGTDWQLLLIDKAGMEGFDGSIPENPENPVVGDGDGSEEKPYTVSQVIGGVSGTDAWVKGYIVGYVPDKSLSEAVFEAPATSASNILIAGTADVKDVSQCVPVQLPAGDVRTGVNLKDNPGNLGKEIFLKGSLEKYFGTNGLKSVSAYKIEGVNPDKPQEPVEPVAFIDENFDASTEIPAGWTQVQVAGTKKWYIPTFNGNNYAAMTGYKGTAPFDQWLMTPPIDMSKVAEKVLTFDTQVNGYGSTTSVFEVYVLDAPDPAKATVKTKLNPTIATAPASGYSDWAASGSLDLSSFSGTVYIAFRYYATEDANFATWCVDNVLVK